jgi:hypothetical protein
MVVTRHTPLGEAVVGQEQPSLQFQDHGSEWRACSAVLKVSWCQQNMKDSVVASQDAALDCFAPTMLLRDDPRIAWVGNEDD